VFIEDTGKISVASQAYIFDNYINKMLHKQISFQNWKIKIGL